MKIKSFNIKSGEAQTIRGIHLKQAKNKKLKVRGSAGQLTTVSQKGVKTKTKEQYDEVKNEIKDS